MRCAVLAIVLVAVGSTKGNAQQLGEQLHERPINVLIEAAWRYPILGQVHVTRSEDFFRLSYHGAVTFMGGVERGFYAHARFDGFGPTGQGPYPFMVSGRLGYFVDVHGWDPGGLRQSTSSYDTTECEQYTTYTERCVTTRHTTTRRWWEPAGWVNGARYFYAGYRQLFNVEGDTNALGLVEHTNPGAVSLGLGITESKFGTFTNELELFYFLYGWDDDERSRWGIAYHGQAMYGPVFIDVLMMLDAGLGCELSLGLGFMFAP